MSANAVHEDDPIVSSSVSGQITPGKIMRTFIMHLSSCRSNYVGEIIISPSFLWINVLAPSRNKSVNLEVKFIQNIFGPFKF